MKVFQFGLESSLKRIFFVFCITVVWTLVVPGVIGKLSGVFSQEDLRQSLPPPAQSKLAAFEAEKSVVMLEMEKVNVLLADALRNTNMSSVAPLLAFKQALRSDMQDMRSPFILLPFFPGANNIFQPCIYLFLGIILVVVRPVRLHFNAAFFRRVIMFAAPITLIYRSPTWLRNAPFFRNTGRVVYSDANLDVAPVMFWWQELAGIGIAIAIAIIWLQWIKELKRVQMIESRTGFAYVSNPLVLRNLAESVIRWQVCSVCLACAFIPLTAYFYDILFHDHDYRYAAQAFIIHGIWLLTWFIISCPLIWLYHQYQLAKLEVFAGSAADAEKLVVKELEPFNIGNLTASAILAALSFLAPIVHGIIS